VQLCKLADHHAPPSAHSLDATAWLPYYGNCLVAIRGKAMGFPDGSERAMGARAPAGHRSSPAAYATSGFALECAASGAAAWANTPFPVGHNGGFAQS